MRVIAIVLAFLTLAAAPSLAAEHEVKMLNKGSNGKTMEFEPAFLRIEPGDTVTFVAEDKGHNVESIKGMLPEGVEKFKSRINRDFTMTFETPGLYGYKCTPHYATGMVGLIQVGDAPTNVDAVKSIKQRGRSKKRFKELFEEFEAQQ